MSAIRLRRSAAGPTSGVSTSAGFRSRSRRDGREPSVTSFSTHSRSTTNTRTCAVHARRISAGTTIRRYEPTQDDRGAYLSDSAGRRPGIYTYLAGFPNFWSKQRIDFNLRTRENPELFAGVFDPSSVMLYRFPPLFYKTATSACAPVGDGTDLSAGDRLGLDTLYPGNGAEAFKAIVAHRQDLLETVSGSNLETGGLEGQGSPASSFARQAIATLRNSLTHL